MRRTAFTPLVLAIALVCGATSCEPTADQSGGLKQPTADESGGLKREIADLKQITDSQASQLAWLKVQIEWLQSKTIFVDVSSQSYQCIDTNTGKFLISCQNVQPYADGQKLTFQIGNPNYVTFTGFQLKAKWGAKAPLYPQSASPPAVTAWQANYANWQKSLHEKDIDSPIELKPGIWNVVEVVLAPAKVEELGYLELSMSTDKVLLYRDKTR